MARLLRFALLGHPLDHTASPAMHTAAFRALGLPHTYEAVPCPTAVALKAAIGLMRNGGIAGLNVTMPWKREVLSMVDGVDASAKDVNAANTLVRRADGKVWAHNTDVPALTEELARLEPRVGTAVIIGAGGAASAALEACKALGIRLIGITSRRWSSSEALYEDEHATHFRDRGAMTMMWPTPESRRATSHASSALRLQWYDLAGTANLIIQATSASADAGSSKELSPAHALVEAVPWPVLDKSTIAFDLVYRTQGTPFLESAQRAGLRAEGGLGMLVRQGALAQELWMGKSGPYDVMRGAAVRHLSAVLRSPIVPAQTLSRSYWSYGYRRIVLLLVALVIIPSVLLSSVGVLLLVLGEHRLNLLLGILTLCFTGAVVTGVVLVWVFVRRDAKLSELQADFVSKVSHELRTPLTSILMFTETLAMRRGNVEDETRCIDALSRESKRLQELIDRLLDWGRMESGRRLYDKRPADVVSVVEDAIGAIEPIRERRGVELSVNLAQALPKLDCDQGALKDAVVNLLSNAYKYGGEPVKITVEAKVEQQAMRISVKDNGAGIPPNEHKRIFDKFYRLDDRLSREREGSGLGLSIVQHVVRAHGGRVDVDSDVGRGSTFTIVIPLGAAALDRRQCAEGPRGVADQIRVQRTKPTSANGARKSGQ